MINGTADTPTADLATTQQALDNLEERLRDEIAFIGKLLETSLADFRKRSIT